MTTGSQRLRADARRNRDQILAAAREVFGAQGSDVPMEEIARAARVGVGTLYRRFPDREALIRAVAHESFAQVLQDTRAAAAEEPTAWGALVRLVGRSQQLQLSMHLALHSQNAKDALHSDTATRELRSALLTEIVQIVDAAQQEGTLRADIGAGDIVILLAMLLKQPRLVQIPAALAFERAVMITLDGLRAQPHDPLPGRPIGAEDIRFE
ncbi:TetR/AcrR family transcriptional regulator [Streptomonospora sediminis]